MSTGHNLDSPRKRLSMRDWSSLSMGISVGKSIRDGLDDLKSIWEDLSGMWLAPSASHQDKRTQGKESFSFCLLGVYFCWQVHLCCYSCWFSHWCWNPSLQVSNLDWRLEAIPKSSQPLDCWGIQPHGFAASLMWRPSLANSEGSM